MIINLLNDLYWFLVSEISTHECWINLLTNNKNVLQSTSLSFLLSFILFQSLDLFNLIVVNLTSKLTKVILSLKFKLVYLVLSPSSNFCCNILRLKFSNEIWIFSIYSSNNFFYTGRTRRCSCSFRQWQCSSFAEGLAMQRGLCSL